jgi:hypothetical protein
MLFCMKHIKPFDLFGQVSEDSIICCIGNVFCAIIICDLGWKLSMTLFDKL